MSDSYVTVHNVPILDEHRMKIGEDAEIDLTPALLEKIARRNNQRHATTGDLSPIIIGHTKGEVGEFVPEEQQPEIVGYASNYKVIPFKKTGRKCIAATFKILRRCLSRVRKFPRRSVELWLGDLKIDPIALLGATTPERDLGLLQLASNGRKVYRRVVPNPKVNPVENQEELVAAVVKALEQTDVWRFMQQKMEEEEAGPEPGLEGEPGLPGEEPPLPEEPPVPEDEPLEDEPEEAEAVAEGKKPARMSAAASAASGTNTFTPSGGLGKRDRNRLQATGDRIRLSRVEKENQDLRKHLQAQRVKLARIEREKDLIELQAEGVDFDMAEELEDGLTMPDAQWAKHLDKMRVRYAKAVPGSGEEWSGHVRTPASAASRSREQMQQIADYAYEKGISYEKAQAELGL